MSYWIGFTPENLKALKEALKKDVPFEHPFFSPIIVKEKCSQCDQIVILTLCSDPLSNSSYLVYRGFCVNEHLNQSLPTTPFHMRKQPRCAACNAGMQWRLAQGSNGWECPVCHARDVKEV